MLLIFGWRPINEQSGDPEGLELAKKAFYWLDSNAPTRYTKATSSILAAGMGKTLG